MKKMNGEKIIFDNFTEFFVLSQFLTTALFDTLIVSVPDFFKKS